MKNTPRTVTLAVTEDQQAKLKELMDFSAKNTAEDDMGMVLAQVFRTTIVVGWIDSKHARRIQVVMDGEAGEQTNEDKAREMYGAPV